MTWRRLILQVALISVGYGYFVWLAFTKPDATPYGRAIAVAIWAVVVAAIVAEGVRAIRQRRPRVRQPWWFVPALLAVGAVWIGLYRFMGWTG